MLTPPAFWRFGGNAILPVLLQPLAAITARVTARRAAGLGYLASVPVICCGNASVGGAGKTTLALDIAQRFLARNRLPAFLTRGHGGTVRGVHCVDLACDTAATVGDEALLLARQAPCYVSADRAAAARQAIADGADVLIMDDGLQNAGLCKTISLLVIDGPQGFGNNHVLPAGPLREPVTCAAARCGAAVLIGPDDTSAAAILPPNLPVLRAALAPDGAIAAFVGQHVFAFAGIGRPEKFFTMLRDAGVMLAGHRAFPDHHVFSATECAELRRAAAAQNAVLVCTPKDHVRLPAAFPATPIGVTLRFTDDPAFANLLAKAAP